MARVVGVDVAVAAQVLPLVRAKLATEPVEDLRIDLEDGFGDRGDDAEDAAVDAAVRELTAAWSSGTATPYCGVRVKSLEAPTRRRGLRSLDRVVGRLADGGRLPAGFVVTLPKVTAVEQVAAMVTACARIEAAHGLATGALRFELQVEPPQAVLARSARPRCRDAHAAAGPLHRAALRHLRLLGGARHLGGPAERWSTRSPTTPRPSCRWPPPAPGCGVVDGSTNVLPVGEPAAVEAALALHARLVRALARPGLRAGLGPAPGPAPARYARDLRLLPRGACPRAGPPAAYLGRRDSASSTSRRPPGPWPGSSPAPSTAAR